MISDRNQAHSLEHLLTVSCQPNELRFLGLTPDPQTLVVGESTKIQLWNLLTKQEVCTLIKVNGILSVANIAMSGDGQTLACQSGMGIIKVWNLLNQKQRLSYRGNTCQISSLAINHDGKIMVSSAFDRTLRVWNLKQRMEIGFLIEHDIKSGYLALSPDGQAVVYVTGSDCGELLKLWHWRTKQEPHILEAHSEDISTVAISGDGQAVVSCNYNGLIKLWNFATTEEMYTLESFGVIDSSAISADGKTILCSNSTLLSNGSKYQFKLWDLITGQAIFIWEEHSEIDSRRTYVALSADGQTLVCGSGTDIKVWRVR